MEICIMQVFSIGSWLFAILTFLFGVLVKYIFNLLSTPKLEIEEHVLLDTRLKPWIRINNRSKWIKAYDLRIFIAYYQNGKRIHTKVIGDGVMKNMDGEKYSIIPKNEQREVLTYDITGPNNFLEVTLLFKNKFNILSVKEKTVVYLG